MYSNIDSDGYDVGFIDSIIDHRVDDAVITKKTSPLKNKSKKIPTITTDGWDLKIKWCDGTTTWSSLVYLKEADPVLVADYAVQHNLVDAPAFVWWVPHVLRKRDRIVNNVKVGIRRMETKFGVHVPRTVDEAHKLDKENDNDFWTKAINKEMANAKVAFTFLQPNLLQLVIRKLNATLFLMLKWT